MEQRRNGSWRVLFHRDNDYFTLFVILSLGEDRCEGKNSKVFTHSALIASDLRRAGEEVKAKKENQLRRAYVRARRSGQCEGACFRPIVVREVGEGRGKVARLCAFVPVFCAKRSRCRGALLSGHHGVRFPFLFGALRCGAMVRAPVSLCCRGGGSAIHPIHRRATTVIRAKQSMLREVMPSILFISRPGGRLSK